MKYNLTHPALDCLTYETFIEKWLSQHVTLCGCASLSHDKKRKSEYHNTQKPGLLILCNNSGANVKNNLERSTPTKFNFRQPHHGEYRK